ncbi:alpha/beta hydrolase [uncultured Draconibacterium sp.]|uniref:alpha/beta fold hydrolase n=1 Tax=uncultured Draconibacterium sp. TaxID=1573823 RepID=UPI0032163F6F
MKSNYTSAQAKNEIKQLYFQKLDELPLHYELIKIETTFGDTNVIATGQKDKTPLVLLHGYYCSAPLALDALIGLTKDFRIYAVDILGQANLSAENRLSKTDNTYGKWMYEILSRLNLWNVVLVGISLGGFVTLKTLIFDERRIAKTFLITPDGIAKAHFLTTALKIKLPIALYKRFKNPGHLQELTNNLFSEKNRYYTQLLAIILKNFIPDSANCPLFNKKDVAQISTPLYIFAAKYDILFPGIKLLKRAKKLFPSIQDVWLLKNSKHILRTDDNKLISQIIYAVSTHPKNLLS